MTQRHIIGVCGFIGSGKGTVADYLVEHHDFVKISFADKLKDAVAVLFSLDRNLLEGDTPESRAWRDVPLPFWSDVFGHEVTPRFIIQRFGTECMRNSFHVDVWTQIVRQQLLDNPDTNFVLPDARFVNEINMIQQFPNAKLWQTRGKTQPEWWDNAMKTNESIADGSEWIVHDKGIHMEVSYPDVHSSEWSWVRPDEQFDCIIHNNSTLANLYVQVEKYLRK